MFWCGLVLAAPNPDGLWRAGEVTWYAGIGQLGLGLGLLGGTTEDDTAATYLGGALLLTAPFTQALGVTLAWRAARTTEPRLHFHCAGWAYGGATYSLAHFARLGEIRSNLLTVFPPIGASALSACQMALNRRAVAGRWGDAEPDSDRPLPEWGMGARPGGIQDLALAPMPGGLVLTGRF